jgi:hypothetical protein
VASEDSFLFCDDFCVEIFAGNTTHHFSEFYQKKFMHKIDFYHDLKKKFKKVSLKNLG